MNTRTIQKVLVNTYKSFGIQWPNICDDEFGENLVRSGAWTQNRRRRKMRHLNNH